MQHIFQLFVIVEVFSLRVPVPGTGILLKLTYPLQAAMIAFLVLKVLSPNRPSFKPRDAFLIPLTQLILLFSVCAPFVFYGRPSATTAGYTMVLFSWVVTAWLLLNNFSISLRTFIRTYLFSIFVLLSLSVFVSLLIGDQRIDSIFGGGTNRLGLYAVIGALISFYIINKKLEPQLQKIYWIGFVICLLAVVLTFSRSALLALFVGFVEHALRNKTFSFKQIIIGCVVVALSIAFLNYQYTSTLDERFLKLMYRFGINEMLGHPYFENLEEVSRLVHYENALSLITGSFQTLVFGLGLESYRSTEFLANSRGEDLTLHSMFLQYLMGGGLLALGCLIALVGAMYIKILKLVAWQRDILMFILVPAVVHASFLPAIFSREILIYVPLLLVSCQVANSSRKSSR